MRLSGVKVDDLVLVADHRGDTFLALVTGREGRTIDVLPLRERHAETVTGYRVVGHYVRRAGEPRLVRNAVARIRTRFGVSIGQVVAERCGQSEVPA